MILYVMYITQNKICLKCQKRTIIFDSNCKRKCVEIVDNNRVYGILKETIQ